MNLANILPEIDAQQARRFAKLTGTALSIAREGIRRHLAACEAYDCRPDAAAIREVIDDAQNGKRIWLDIDPGEPVEESRGRSSTIEGGHLLSFGHFRR